MKKHKNKIIAGAVIAIVLVFAFWYGGATPSLHGGTIVQNDATIPMKTTTAPVKATIAEEMPVADALVKEEVESENPAEAPLEEQIVEPQEAPYEEQNALEEVTSDAQEQQSDVAYSEAQGMHIDEETGMDAYLTEPVPEGRPVPIEPENAVITDKELTCTLSVRCDTILQNIGWLDSEKVDIVPKDGVIFAEKTVTFYEGESVFNLLMREMKRNKIHMEFENTPIYNSAYIEGIANLYEFDCGELSGWMYKVNGWFPNYGCSRYQLKAGDKVEWVYTCDLGNDVGGNYSARNGN